MQGEESVAAWVEQDEQRKTAEEAAARADVREKCFNSDRHRRIALDLARLRYVKMIAGTAIDEIKTMFNTWVQSAVEEFLSELEPMLEIPVEQRLHTISVRVKRKFDFFDGLQSEAQELAAILPLIPIATPQPRELGVEQRSTDAEGNLPLQPKKTRKRMAYDFEVDALLVRLMEHSATARSQVYDTLDTWGTETCVKKMKPSRRIISDIVDADVFSEYLRLHPGNGVTLTFALVLYSDAFTVRVRQACASRAVC